MKDELIKMIDAVVSQDEEAAQAHFSSYLRDKTSALIAEKDQGDMFGDTHKTKSDQRFLVKPTGMGYESKDHAIASAKNHPDKDVEVVDTESDSVVYSHKGKGKKKNKEE